MEGFDCLKIDYRDSICMLDIGDSSYYDEIIIRDRKEGDHCITIQWSNNIELSLKKDGPILMKITEGDWIRYTIDGVMVSEEEYIEAKKC